MSNNNVFKFPEHKIVREIPPQVEEVERAKEKGKQNYAEDIAMDFAESILAVLDSYGIDQDTKHFDKDFSFTIESIRAMIYRSLSLDHHLHEFIDEHVSILKKDKDGNMILEVPEGMEEIIISEIEKIQEEKENVDSDK
jgi:hypothetical protein